MPFLAVTDSLIHVTQNRIKLLGIHESNISARMKALILVGGYGTRLRPLTLTVPKPLIQFCNKSLLEHQLEALVKAGVRHVILAVAYQPDTMMIALKELELKFNIKIVCSREEEPLGTAGPIRLAETYLRENSNEEDDSFFVFNSDIICDFPLEDMTKFHNKHGKLGTVLVTKVENPSLYGVIISEEATGKIQKFIEKPKTFVGDCINAGVYLLKNKSIDLFELKPSSIEREIFPLMASNGTLYSFKLQGFWADIGQPCDFLRGMHLYLSSKSSSNNNIELGIKENVLIHPTAKIGKGCIIGPDVTIGEGCIIGNGVRIINSALMANVKISSNSFITKTIIGWQSRIGQWVRIEGLTVVGEDVSISDECFINKAIILPNKQLNVGIYEPGKIIM